MKTLSLSIILLLGFTQFSLQFLKLLPKNPMMEYYRPITEAIGLEFMSQNWRLFAPEPPKSTHRFMYRCSFAEYTEFTPWVDPVEEPLFNHHQNRLSGDQYLVRYYKDSIRVLNNTHSQITKAMKCKDKECLTKALGSLEKTSQYKTMSEIVVRLCKSRHGSGPQFVQFRAIKVDPVPFSKRNEKNPKRKLDINNYPVIKV